MVCLLTTPTFSKSRIVSRASSIIRLIVSLRIPVALLESEEKEQNSGKLRGDESTGGAAFTPTWQQNPLLVEVATEIGINPVALHLRQRSQQYGIRQSSVDCPALECTRLKNSHPKPYHLVQ
jgi:hypothetical protein